MTEEQFNKAKSIVDRINVLKNLLAKIDNDLIQVKGNLSMQKYYLLETSLVLYRDDVVILLSNKKVYLNNEIDFLEKQLKII